MHRRLGGTGAPIVRLFTGSSSPVYHQLHWLETDIRPSSIATVKAGGDRKAGRLARNWDRALVMTVGRTALESIVSSSKDYRLAVGFVSDDILHVGLLPEGVMFGYEANGHTATAAMRQGRHLTETTMGVWTPDGKIIIPADLNILSTLVPVNDLPRTHPGTPLF